MTKAEAEALAAKALPCPFCGASLVVHYETVNTFNPDGVYELKHPRNTGCNFFHHPWFGLDMPHDVDDWNRRTEPKKEN